MYVLLPLLDRQAREGGMRSTVTRRDLLHGGIAAGIAFRLNLIGSDAAALQLDPAADAVPGAIDADGRLGYRTDALATVTGEKTFSRDFRARDLPGWPSEQSHAFLIHATQADRTFEGIDLSVLGNDLQPDRLVTAEDLQRDRVAPHRPTFYGDFFWCPKARRRNCSASRWRFSSIGTLLATMPPSAACVSTTRWFV